MSEDPTPKEVISELCDAQGRKIEWIARRLGMDGSTLHNTLAGRARYKWKPGQKQMIADMLGVPLHYIWRDEVPAAAE